MKNIHWLLIAIIIPTAAAAGLSSATQKKSCAHVYCISSQTGTGYVVAEELDGEVENVDYECVDFRPAPCTVCADGIYSPGQVIPFSQATVIIANRICVDLDPNK